MSTVTGYYGGPAATGTPVQANFVAGGPRSVVLNCNYYPVPAGIALGARPSLPDSQPMPLVLPAGTSITVSPGEAAALIAANVAMGA